METTMQKQVFEFARHWMTAYEAGFTSTDCTFHAMQLTNVSLSVPEHRDIARRALEIVSLSGLSIN